LFSPILRLRKVNYYGGEGVLVCFEEPAGLGGNKGILSLLQWRPVDGNVERLSLPQASFKEDQRGLDPQRELSRALTEAWLGMKESERSRRLAA
jgi:hypothetical protein